MKKIILSVIVVATLYVAQAQTVTPAILRPAQIQETPMEELAKRETDKLDKELKLSDSQKTQVNKVIMDKLTALKASKSSQSTPEGYLAEEKTIKEKYAGKISSLLTAEQKEKYTKMLSSKL
jgi:hypothetical protein